MSEKKNTFAQKLSPRKILKIILKLRKISITFKTIYDVIVFVRILETPILSLVKKFL